MTPSDKTVWSGDSFKIKTKCFAARNDTDTNTANDWYNFKIGWTNIQFDPEVKFDATVTPFLFPDSGGIPIYNALEDAKSNVCITLYLLTSKNMCGLLNELLKKGIDITLLLEEKPLGYTSDLNSIQTLINNGAKVMFINSSDDNDRYVYVHAKYCIIDDKTTIIMSENWVTDNLSCVATDIYASGVDISKVKGNRGWGAIVESADYANYMKKIFENDCDKSYGDVRDFSDVYSNVTPYTPTYSKPSSTLSLSSYNCQVTPMFSPDSSWDGTNYYISTATDRIYAENQSLTASYTDVSNTSPIKYMAEKAASGVDTRFIINDNESVALEINQKTLIKTASMKTPYVHNKGLICDDMALVSSVNWTDTSFNSNREMCVAILSKDIADYFANAFLSDFNANYTYLGLDVKVSEISEHYDEAGVITVSVDVEQDGTYTYYWDLDGTTKTTTVPRTTLDVGEGSHTLNVTVTDTTGTTGLVTSSFTVGNDDTNHLDVSGLIDSVRPYIIPIIVVILAILIAIVKSASGGNKKSKGGKKKR